MIIMKSIDFAGRNYCGISLKYFASVNMWIIF